jgi:hypothetical protein
MKSWRIWLLLLLAVLLPVRGAVAAAMLCPVAGSGIQTELAVVNHPTAHEAMDHAMEHDHGVSHEHAVGGHHDGHDHTATDKCNMCSAFCSLTPLVSEVQTVAEPLDPTAVKFSELSAPPPSFFSDGQERPPRTI